MRPPRLEDVRVDASKFTCVTGPVPREQSVGATGMVQVRVRDARQDTDKRRPSL